MSSIIIIITDREAYSSSTNIASSIDSSLHCTAAVQAILVQLAAEHTCYKVKIVMATAESRKHMSGVYIYLNDT